MSTPTPPENPKPASQRLLSLDALRGFDMFWIVGGGSFVHALKSFKEFPLAVTLAEQTEHVAWEGFRFYDLIFPLFVFLSGVSLVFSLTKQIEKDGRKAAMRRLIPRALTLFLLGVLANGGVAKGFENIRWLGVLQRIALAYLGAGLLFIWLKPRGLIAALVAILLGYWALLTLVPVPEVGAGVYAEGQNLTNYLDRMYLPGRKYDKDHDPEGLLSTLPAIASCLLGIFAGLWLRSPAPDRKKVLGLVVAGVAMLAIGWTWGIWFPVIKKLWTSSFVLVAGGWSALLLAAFYYGVEIRGWRRAVMPFVWIGMNPITIFLAGNFIGFGQLAQRFVGGDISQFLNTSVHPGMGDLLSAAVVCSFAFLISRFLYKHQIFLRV